VSNKSVEKSRKKVSLVIWIKIQIFAYQSSPVDGLPVTVHNNYKVIESPFRTRKSRLVSAKAFRVIGRLFKRRV
jgi:hypothetical protein